jgi:hypothetical protein
MLIKTRYCGDREASCGRIAKVRAGGFMGI